MKKFLLLLISVFVCFFAAKGIFAATTAGTNPQPATEAAPPPAMNWHCLDYVQCSDANADCSGQGVTVHRAKLTTKTGDLPSRDAQTTIFVCFATEFGNVCTSGDSQLDMQKLGYDGIAKLKSSTVTGGNYTFQGLFLKDGKTEISNADVKSNASGRLIAPVEQVQTRGFIKEVYAAATQGTKVYEPVEPLEWQDATPIAAARKWLALNLVSTKQEPTGTGGQKQGTFTFEGALGHCVPITWDPYGIVFDSQSLEPIDGAKVILTRERANGQFTLVNGADTPSILNPFVTTDGGTFSFFVPDGIYRMQVSKSGFTFPNLSAKLNANALNIYSDIYRGEDIIQKGKVEHRDVPLDSLATPYHSPIKIISYFPLLDKGTNTYYVQGKVSHPLANLQLYGRMPDASAPAGFVKTRVLTSTRANKLGQFNLSYDLSQLSPTEMIGNLEATKSDLSQTSSAVNVQGASTQTDVATLALEPIPNYLEGYAYDSNHNALPKATVGVYLTYSNKPAYQTTADENGYYKISSEYLPPMAYDIKYTTATGLSYTIAPSKFIAENADFIKSQQTDLYQFKNKNGQLFSATSQQKYANNGITPQPETTRPPTEESTSSQGMLEVVVALIVALVLIGTSVVIYIMRKKRMGFQTPPPDEPPQPSVPSA